MFPFLGVLQHYAKFNIHTLVTLEKLLGVRSFNGSIGHLAHHQATFPTSSSGLSLCYVV